MTESLGIDLPFISAGMGFLARPALAAAVSEAGGLGLLGTAPCSPPTLASWIEETSRATARPFGVDFVVEDTAFGPATTEDHLAVVLAHDVQVVVFFWHAPPARWIGRLKVAGRQVWMQVATLDEARLAAEQGFDAVIVQGAEAGGHNRSEAGCLVAVPATVDAIAPVPVIAAGGISDGRGVAAALALGASGVVVGTRLIASAEAHAHAGYKQRVVDAGLDDATRTRLFGVEWPDQPMNVLRNRVVEAWSGRDQRTPTGEPSAVVGHTRIEGNPYPIPRFSAVLPTPETEGDLDEMCLAAGHGSALVDRVLPAAEIVTGMMQEAAEVIHQRLAGLVGTADAPANGRSHRSLATA